MNVIPKHMPMWIAPWGALACFDDVIVGASPRAHTA